ncbi:lipoyl(octanoyl) transferase 2 isoform X2 [Oratosquilla oratoria]
MIKNLVRVYNLGHQRYSPTWELQKMVASHVHAKVERGEEPGHTLLLVQHDPVYTIGLRQSEYTLAEEERLKALGADFQRTNRGGLITFLGPGQLTAYPILHLASFAKGIKWYVCALERTVIRTCQMLDVLAETSPHTGVWVKDKKICALGIQGRHVTTHGLAFNCNIDLQWFDHIIPCGIKDKGVTSLSTELKRDVTVEEVTPIFLQMFSDIFNCEMVMEGTLEDIKK